MGRYISRALVLAIGLFVSGCYTDFGPVERASEPTRPYVATRFQPGDRIKVTVYGEDNLTGVYDIDGLGNVSLPLAGTLKAAGRTKVELQREITAKYRSGDFLQDPKVTVDAVTLRPFYVMGEVEHPGEFSYRSDLDVLSAITMAGGLTYRGSRATVLIKHAGDGVWKEYALGPTVMVAPGDLIRIPERYF